MSCFENTPYTISDYPFRINRLRKSSGDDTDQSTGEWTSPIETSLQVKGYLGVGGRGMSTNVEKMKLLSGGQFEVGDLFFSCHSGCDTKLNDLLEAYDDASGTTKTYWRIITKIAEKHTLDKLVPFGRYDFLVRKELRK